MSTKKYRPYFTLVDLKHLHHLSHSHSQVSPLTRYLARYIQEIDSGFLSPALSLKPTLEQKLELSLSPDSKTVFQKEQEARYLNNEMSPSEERDYEKINGLVL